MKRKDNILFKGGFGIVFISIILFTSKYIGSDVNDSYVYGWLIIFGTSMLIQIIFIKGNYTQKSTHIIFIVFSLLITMFASYIMNKHITVRNCDGGIFSGDGGHHMLIALIESTILFVIKIILGAFLKMNHSKVEEHIEGHKKSKEKIVKLEDEIEVLKTQNMELKSQDKRWGQR